MTQSNEITQPPPLRRAAILVAALDRQDADAVLDEMGPEDAACVRAAIMDLDDVSAEEQHRVISEFMRRGGPTHSPEPTGIELDDALANQLAAAPSRSTKASHLSEDLEPPPFRFLHEATTDGLARHLEREHPQIIAVVVAHLRPKQSADLIKQFPESLQVDVLRRVAKLDATSPEVLRDLESQLEVLLSDEIRAARNRSAGAGAVASILEAAAADREDLLNAVARDDEQLVSLIAQNKVERGWVGTRPDAATASQQTQTRVREPIPDGAATRREDESATNQRRSKLRTRQKPERAVKEPSRPLQLSSSRSSNTIGEPGAKTGFSFEDLSRLEDRELATLFQTADTQIVVLALTGADDKLVKRVMRQLPSRQSRKLQRQMKQLGPIQISDVERAQRSIAELANHLASRNVIRLPHARRFAVAA